MTQGIGWKVLVSLCGLLIGIARAERASLLVKALPDKPPTTPDGTEYPVAALEPFAEADLQAVLGFLRKAPRGLDFVVEVNYASVRAKSDVTGAGTLRITKYFPPSGQATQVIEVPFTQEDAITEQALAKNRKVRDAFSRDFLNLILRLDPTAEGDLRIRGGLGGTLQVATRLPNEVIDVDTHSTKDPTKRRIAVSKVVRYHTAALSPEGETPRAIETAYGVRKTDDGRIVIKKGVQESGYGWQQLGAADESMLELRMGKANDATPYFVKRTIEALQIMKGIEGGASTKLSLLEDAGTLEVKVNATGQGRATAYKGGDPEPRFLWSFQINKNKLPTSPIKLQNQLGRVQHAMYPLFREYELITDAGQKFLFDFRPRFNEKNDDDYLAVKYQTKKGAPWKRARFWGGKRISKDRVRGPATRCLVRY